MTSTRVVLVLLGLLALFALGLALRWDVYAGQPLLQELRKEGKAVPFTLESALQFRQVKEVMETGKLAERDPLIRTDDGEGLNVRETYTVGSERVYAVLASVMPRTWSLEDRVRAAARLVFVLAIPLLALWVGMEFRSVGAGLVAGLFYAVGYAALVRSTGQSLSRENFALPLLMLFLASEVWARRSANRWRSAGGGPPTDGALACGVGTLLAATGLALAQCNWDLSQALIGMWVAWRLLQVLAGERAADWREGLVWWIPCAALLAAALANPYLRAHGFVFSPVMGLALGLALVLAAQAATGRRDPRWQWALALAPVLALWLAGQRFGLHYGHFGELLAAKLSFFNVKPADPGLLSFPQRFMWTPALNSTNWYALFDVFPYALHAAILGAAWMGGSRWLGARLWVAGGMLVVLLAFDGRLGFRLPETFSLAGFFALAMGTLALAGLLWADGERRGAGWTLLLGLSWFLFILFFRFHVFLAVWTALLLGGGLAAAWAHGDRWRWAWTPVVSLVLLLETMYILTPSVRSGKLDRTNTSHAELLDLIEVVKRHKEQFETQTGKPPVILTNIGLSAMLRAYTDCPVVLHPKFETEDVRERTEAYVKGLYNLDETDFYEWTQEMGAQLYIHTRVAFGDNPVVIDAAGKMWKRPDAVKDSLRYMADAMEPRPDAAVRRLEQGHLWPNTQERKDALAPPRYFVLAPGRAGPSGNPPPEMNHSQGRLGGALQSRFRVYRIVTHDDLDTAANQAKMARKFLEAGDYRRAFDYAERAVKLYDPGNVTARKVIQEIVKLTYLGRIDQEALSERVKMYDAEQ